jgi:hypothetical protein
MIDRNCDVLPLSLDDLLNYTTLMLKSCINKRIWALLLRQVCFFWGERGHFAPKKGVTLHPRATDFREKKAVFFGGGGRERFAQKKGVTLHPQATDFQEKKSYASSIRIVSYCKYDMYFNKYDMYSIVGIDKKCMEKELV